MVHSEEPDDQRQRKQYSGIDREHLGDLSRRPGFSSSVRVDGLGKRRPCSVETRGRALCHIEHIRESPTRQIAQQLRLTCANQVECLTLRVDNPPSDAVCQSRGHFAAPACQEGWV